MKKFSPKFDTKIFSRCYQTFPVIGYSVLESTYIRFMLIWGTFYLSFLGFFVFVNTMLRINNTTPHSLTNIINSPWGGFIVLSLLCALLFYFYYPKSVSTENFFTINSSQLTVSNTDLILSVFSCRPPILHTKEDFSFFLTNFKPLSIEIKPSQQLIQVIVYSRNADSFPSKIKECQNQLNSLFSNVTLITNSDLKNFILNGYKLYNQKSSHLELYDFNALKSMGLRPIKSNIQNPQSDSLYQSHTDSIDKPNAFLLMLSNFSTYNSTTKDQQRTYFRGIRLGFDNDNQIVKSASFKGIDIKNLKHFFLSTCRVPEKNTIHQDISELEKIYFFILHKYFNYFFHDEMVNEQKKSNYPVKKQQISHTSDITPNKSSPQILKSKNKEVILKKPQVKIPVKKSIQQNNHEKTLKTTSSSKLNNIQKIVFQFTYFCQYFCPIMNNEFKNFSTGSKKDFTVPEGCYDHIKSANTNLVDFIEKQGANESIELVFTQKDVTEKFFDFIQEKELKSIDKICHFSSIILLSPHKHEINENDILNFIKNLEGDYFVS